MFIEMQTTAMNRVVQVNANTTFSIVGNISTGVILFKQSDGAGGWFSIVEDGTTKSLSATNTVTTFYGPITVRVEKPATVAAVGVAIN